MPKINILSKQTAELIAAGEVVERPASVIKELLENCVDAGATSVTAEIKNGGITYMRVTDNGCGIEREDVPAAFMSHATSKIKTGDDLAAIYTLGFRGEALASVAAVARVELLTRTENESAGTRYVIEGGEPLITDDAGCPRGTTILVRDLFYNTPARMKFLKKDVSEANAVAAVADRMALSHPEVAFRFIREGKQTLSTSGDGQLGSAIYSVFGREFFDGLIPTDYESDGIRVSGYISKPSNSRPNRSMQLFFLNGRMIHTGTGSAALSEGYKGSVMTGKFPACVLNIVTKPHTVDVNVHPAKLDVRFENERPVFNAVYFAVRNALSGDTSRVKHGIKNVSAQQVKNYFAALDASVPKQISLGTQRSPSTFKLEDAGRQVPQTDRPADDFLHLATGSTTKSPAQASESAFERVRENKIENECEISAPLTDNSEEAPEPPSDSGVSTDASKTGRDENAVQTADEKASAPMPEFRYIGQAFSTYLLAESGGKILVIDKHAAHERMIYEQLRARDDGIEHQLLLSPVAVTLDKLEYSAVLENLDVLSDNGFLIEDFGSGTVLVSECPVLLSESDLSEIVQQLAGYLTESRHELISEKAEWIYHSVACRAAVKAGDFTSDYEAVKFIEKLLSMPDIRCCPHGRPVLIEITHRELDKSFGRV